MSVEASYGPLTEIQMQSDEIDYITSNLSSDDVQSMIEWGSGGSTVKWLETIKNTNKSLLSIEHNPLWHDKVHNYLYSQRKDLTTNFKYEFAGELYKIDHGYATLTEEHPVGLDNYLIPKNHVEQIVNGDLFLIDGIARATIAMILKFTIKNRNAIVLIHDYKGREAWYSWATQFYSKIEQVGSTLVRLHL